MATLIMDTCKVRNPCTVKALMLHFMLYCKINNAPNFSVPARCMVQLLKLSRCSGGVLVQSFIFIARAAAPSVLCMSMLGQEFLFMPVHGRHVADCTPYGTASKATSCVACLIRALGIMLGTQACKPIAGPQCCPYPVSCACSTVPHLGVQLLPSQLSLVLSGPQLL